MTVKFKQLLLILLIAPMMWGKELKIYYYPSKEYISFNKLIDMLMKADVIYIGEIHTYKEIHEFQLKVIKAIYEREPYIAIAMEMFQAPFQKYLDQYIECEIDEDKMLELTEYKKRWKYNPDFYRGIWRFAKENEITVIAMNIPTELIREIRKKGLENISSEYLPPVITKPDEVYKRLLIKALESHKVKNIKSFLDIQMAWDNGMAYSIYRYLWTGEYEKIIVIVGFGHIYMGRGIPTALSNLAGPLIQYVLIPSKDKMVVMPVRIPPEEEEEEEELL